MLDFRPGSVVTEYGLDAPNHRVVMGWDIPAQAVLCLLWKLVESGATETLQVPGSR